MTTLRTRLLVAGLLGHLVIQMWHTLADRNRWPFCSYNMFSFRAKDLQTHRRVRLVTDRGAVLGPMSVWGLLPLEFFRVDTLVKKVFLQNTDPQLMDAFCADVIGRLNGRGWPAWDEVKKSPSPPPGHRVVALELYAVETDLMVDDPHDALQVRKATLVHSYDPDRVLGHHESPAWRLPEGA